VKTHLNTSSCNFLQSPVTSPAPHSRTLPFHTLGSHLRDTTNKTQIPDRTAHTNVTETDGYCGASRCAVEISTPCNQEVSMMGAVNLHNAGYNETSSTCVDTSNTCKCQQGMSLLLSEPASLRNKWKWKYG
jgi:hypothetical protein